MEVRDAAANFVLP